MSIPQITVQGWHHDGPVYRIHRKLSGWRNRKARRAGELPFDQVGHPGGRNVEDPAVFMVYASGADEVYALNRGYVYEIEQILDGNVGRILVDAREDYLLHTFQLGLEFLGARALDDEELDALLEQADGDDVEEVEVEQPSNVSDGSESQEVAEVDVPEPPVEPQPTSELETPAVPEDVQNVSPSGQIGVLDLGGDVPPTSDPLAPADPDPVVEPPELTDKQVDAIDTAEDEALEDARDEKAELNQLAAELGVQLEELEALSPEERAELTGSTESTPEGTSTPDAGELEATSDDDDASGGDDVEDAADEEE